ncbi:MAG: hypothetical protein HQM14_08320 [SAR324 cluster bacterium]|nr:hypothetical protein [SAR324 cluster bacterium]
MKNINLETQINALYDKAKIKKAQTEQGVGQTTFNDTLKSTIQRMNEISDRADDALKSLSSTNKGELKDKIDHAGSIHQKIMEEQHNLAALYEKIKIDTDS